MATQGEPIMDKSESPLVCIHLVGDYGSGKKSLVKRFVHYCFDCEKEFEHDPQTLDRLALDTLDFKEKITQIDGVPTKVRLLNYISESPESPRYLQKVARCAMAAGAAIVFDLTNRKSYERVADHIKFIRDTLSLEKMRGYPIAIVGNKLDLVLADPNSRRIGIKEAMEFCESLPGDYIRYFETSSKDGINVDEPILWIVKCAQELRRRSLENRPPESGTTGSYCILC